MELLGTWKLKSLFYADENGTKWLTAEDILAFPDEEDCEDYKKMLRSDFILSEAAMDMYYQPTEEEMPIVEEEGWEVTEKGILLESYPARIENGQVLLDYEREGKEYCPVEMDEDGCLIIGDMMKLKKVE